DSEEQLAALRNQFDNLTQLESEVLVCHYVAGMSQRQIAEAVGIHKSTVNDKIHQALDHLRKNLAQAGVAAVLPLLSAESIFEAVTTGYSCPPGLTAATVLSHSSRLRMK